jgi:hypothetical protein
MKRPIYLWLFVGIMLLIILSLSCRRTYKNKQIVKIEGDYICISLNNYFHEVTGLIQSGSPVPAELDSLFGMSWLEGYVVDNENKDIILVGKSVRSRPTYHIEDLFVNFQNVFDSINSPYCSLDPIPENILNLNRCLTSQYTDFESAIKCCEEAIGGQRVVTGGVPRNSRHAKIMIFADYDMKKISQGLLKDTGVRSCIDFSAQDSAGKNESSEIGATMSRFWFHIKENNKYQVYPNYIENEGIVFINECPVVVLTEKQIADAEGNLKDNAQEVDKSAELFAAEMSSKFSDLTNRSAIFAELENLFRLQACFRALKMKNAVESSGIDLSCISTLSLKPGINDLPETLPGLINYKIYEKTTQNQDMRYIEQQLYIVAGGVSQEMTINESNLAYEKSIAGSGEIIITERPKKESIYWTANLSD